MPTLNGIQATNLIKKSSDETVIVGLSTLEDTYIIDAFLLAGASAVVSKMRIGDLLPVIQQACKNRGQSLSP